MKRNESILQQNCVKWFRYRFPKLQNLLIAVPNGGFRNIREAAKLKSEGVVPGVADLLLLVPSYGFGSLAIEMKFGNGKQTENQKNWQTDFERSGNKYIVCNSFDQFVKEVTDYLT